jgi:ATP-dependent DNA helicase RecG
MAPTETLAEQHFGTLESLLSGAPVPATLLTGSTPAARRRDTRAKLATGELGLVVGTHALISEGVEFARLGVAVIDEQHRFGVRQRAALDARGPEGTAPHALHMSATPIPRTLSLTAFGDLDTTTLRELPAGRRPIRTWVVGEDKRAGAYEYLRERLREGRQGYVICPLVTESDVMQARAATEEAKRLAAGELADFSVAAMHGQMAPAERAAAMERFMAGELDVLVATTVVEVGVDVANAAVMVIEEAERFGLSQLHQLRGRIGRGEHESACILFADPEGERARMRLEAIAAGKDGFELAEVDLAVRGEGEVLGTRQHGLPSFRVASLPEDAGLLFRARQLVGEWVRAGELDTDSELLAPLVAEARARYGDERVERIAA